MYDLYFSFALFYFLGVMSCLIIREIMEFRASRQKQRDDTLTPEDFPLPETEKTLFGWSVRVFDYRLKSWFTLPDFFKTEDSALCHAELYLMAIDFNPFNDNGGKYV